MLHFDVDGLDAMEQRYRATLVNCLSGFKSLNLVATQDMDGRSNVAIFNSVIHLGAKPALMGMVIRPDSVERHTFENIMATKCFTINHVNENIYQSAHQSSARYPRQVSEFDACGLTEEYKQDFFAPFVKESSLQIGLQLVETTKMLSNQTIFVVGAIKHVFMPASALHESGFVDLEMLGTIAGSGLDSYHRTTKINRLAYAKPGVSVKNL